MIKSLLFISLFLFTNLFLIGQNGRIKGVVVDEITGESLIGVNIMYAQGKGAITDLNGAFTFDLPYGEYELTFSYVGYVQRKKRVKLDKSVVNLKISLKNKTLQEVEIVADVAKTRETPVAFSTIKPAKLEEELASQDIPMVLNSTPGVYATQQGGGDGDARINIRGFNQRNIAVMLDGIPVNDMENGWVYWSNWFGLDMVTRSIQVQRGLGASKLALPSVGGTMNILTRGIEAKKQIGIKQEVGSDGFTRTSLGVTTGRMKNGWGITFAGSYKQGNGWVDQAWTKGYFYYLRIDKKIGNHLISFSTMGAPQSHGQRSYKRTIQTYDTAFASKLGVKKDDYIKGTPVNLGLRYNSHWGYLTRYAAGETDSSRFNEKQNFYYKPMYSLRDYWNVSKKLYMSNIVYLSIGDGGGLGLAHSTGYRKDGTYSIQNIYNGNLEDTYYGRSSNNFVRASMNNHFWVGFLNTTEYKMNKTVKLSGGIDMRYYEGEHYRTIHDMLGGTSYKDRKDLRPSDLTNPHTIKQEGDIIYYHNKGLVGWSGVFGQIKYLEGNLSAFVNLTFAYTGYKRVDYFKKKDLIIDGEVYEQAVGYSKLMYDIKTKDFRYYPDTFVVEGKEYTIESSEARTAQTSWLWLPGYTLKGGVNYNFTETQNVFVNVGYLNKAPRFKNVYDNNNIRYKDIKNEKIMAGELGYSYYNKKFTFNFNAYVTYWENKPADRPFTFTDTDDNKFSVNINGMNALHTGVEGEIGYRITDNILSETVISLGDWKWLSSDSAEIVDENTGDIVGKTYFNAKGIYVGDAAQTQMRESLRWQLPWKFVKGVYLKAAITYFGKNYAQFDPITLNPKNYPGSFDEEGKPKQSWKIPDYYTVDIFAGYSFKIKNVRMKLNFVVLNALDEMYVSDAQNNDSYTGQAFNSSDARSAGVFFGMGRRFMTSLAIKF